MSTSIIPQLVMKDFLIVRKTILMFGLVSLVCVAIVKMLFGRVPNWAFINLAFILLVAPPITCAMVILLRTIVIEKIKSTQSFIMSLPVTVKEFTVAKLLANLPIFTAFWLLAGGVSFYFVFGLGVLPYGTLPFVTMIFLGIFVAYICILSTSLLFQSQGITVFAILFFEMGTSGYLWAIVYFDPIENHVYDQVSVWNSTAVGIVATQMLVAVCVLLITLYIQNKKRDFI